MSSFFFDLWMERIPERYYRTFEEKPFETCDFCTEPILSKDSLYLIYKFYDGEQVAHELALCYSCILELQKGISDQSMLAMNGWLDKEDLNLKRDPIITGDSQNKAELLTEHCVVCNIPRTKTGRHVEYALCKEMYVLLRTIHPFSVCEGCLLKIHDSLSKETKEHEDDFWRRYLGLPPNFDFNTPDKAKAPIIRHWIF